MCVLLQNSNPGKLLTATKEMSSLHNASLPERLRLTRALSRNRSASPGERCPTSSRPKRALSEQKDRGDGAPGSSISRSKQA